MLCFAYCVGLCFSFWREITRVERHIPQLQVEWGALCETHKNQKVTNKSKSIKNVLNTLTCFSSFCFIITQKINIKRFHVWNYSSYFQAIKIGDSPDKANMSINPFSHTVYLPTGKGKSLCCDMNSRSVRRWGTAIGPLSGHWEYKESNAAWNLGQYPFPTASMRASAWMWCGHRGL